MNQPVFYLGQVLTQTKYSLFSFQEEQKKTHQNVLKVKHDPKSDFDTLDVRVASLLWQKQWKVTVQGPHRASALIPLCVDSPGEEAGERIVRNGFCVFTKYSGNKHRGYCIQLS